MKTFNFNPILKSLIIERPVTHWIFLLFVLTSSFNSSARADNWFCTSEASQRLGSEIRACGVGSGKDEEQARGEAFVSAKLEFDRICNSSSDCAGKPITTEPLRSDCQPAADHVSCRRMIVFHIVDSQPDVQSKVTSAQSKQGPKVDKRMSKTDFVTAFGNPDQVVDAGNGFLILRYGSRPFCGNSGCHVLFKGDRVDSFDGFNSENTHLLEQKSFFEQLKFW